MGFLPVLSGNHTKLHRGESGGKMSEEAQSALLHGASTPPQGTSTLPHGASTPPQGESTLPHGASSLQGAQYPPRSRCGSPNVLLSCQQGRATSIDVSCPTIGDEAADGGEGCLRLDECSRRVRMLAPWGVHFF